MNPRPAPGIHPILAAALMGANVDPARRADAREALKLMTPEERVQICPPGYTGRARAKFINHGLLADEQGRTDTKETTMSDTTTARTPRTPRKAAAESTSITAAQAARDAGIDGRHFRAFLRTKGMPRQFDTKADANKAIRAFQADAKRKSRDAAKKATADKAPAKRTRKSS